LFCENIPSFFNICQRADRFIDTLKAAFMMPLFILCFPEGLLGKRIL